MASRNEPLIRSCVVSRLAMPTDRMIRFVLDPEGRVVPDLRRRLPGRGVWVTARWEILAAAERKKVFSRGFRVEAKVEPGLADRVDSLLEDAALQSLSFARKAGEILTGFAKVEAAIARDAVIAIVQAKEAGDDGREKIEAALRRRFGKANSVPIVRIFASGQLDLALGRSNVIHAALLAGRASENAMERVATLARFRGEDGLVGIGDGSETEPPEMPEKNAPGAAQDPQD
ncbi:RNA-binding protein [Kaistia algarum]|uniref:RNA-binding protein n=1 Tax=Kaistia algarum TaxID=2083279 RepID=UPI000CE8D771|nr:RNA-binding protein [Kaistia algarum]MCX5513786.1 RNA-binding protein [Kaistia algarum]PPE79348.1 RNA-binding protein [Kaistia algarum]